MPVEDNIIYEPPVFHHSPIRSSLAFHEVVKLFFHRLNWLTVNNHFHGPVRVTDMASGSVLSLPRRIAVIHEFIHDNIDNITNNASALFAISQFVSIIKRDEVNQSMFAFGLSLFVFQSTLRDLVLLAQEISQARAIYADAEQPHGLWSSIGLALEFWHRRLPVALRNDMFHEFGNESFVRGVMAGGTQGFSR